MRRLLRLSLVGASFLSGLELLSTRALGQVEQATLTGTVTDQGGGVVADARVVAMNVRTGVARETRTNDRGHYTIPYLPPGQYEILVEAKGFGTTRVSGADLGVGLVATVDVVLKLGSLQEQVMVTASAIQLEQETASLGNVVGSAQLLELPLFGRNPYSLVVLAPGVVNRGNAGAGPIIDGGRSNTSEVLLDGAETRNSTTNDIAYTPPLEVVQEFKVITNSMSAEFGRSGGGVLTAATRSGTNALHGSFYEFLRNDKLNANSWSNNRVALPRSPFRRNEYGFATGGPIELGRLYRGRDRSFFFFNWEQTKQRSPDDIIATVPTSLERAGDFSATVDGSGRLIRIFDPATGRSDPARPGNFLRDQFSGNRIPTTRLDPVSLKVLELLPKPNRTTVTQNFVETRSRLDDSTRWFLRLDHALGTRQRLFFSYGRADNPRFTEGINLAYPGEGTNGEKGKIESHPRYAVLSDTVSFRPNLVGEFRTSYARSLTQTAPRSAGYDFSQLGIASSVRQHAKSLLFPRFNITDVTGQSLGPDRASFFNDTERAQEAQGHLTWIRGAHALKAGTDFTFMAFNVFRPERPAGSYDFARTYTQGPDPLASSGTAGHGFATFLLGAPTGGQITDDPTLAASQRYYAWYAQDDWKVLRRLTVNLGVRWEYQTPWSDRFDQLAFFDPAAVEPLSGEKGVLRFVGRDGNSRYQYDPDRNNFAPRAGIAWQVGESTVVRVGYGLFYFPGSGGIGAGASDLGGGFLATTPIFLGQTPDVPNTPPAGASLANPFLAGYLSPPSTAVGAGVTTALRSYRTPFNHQWNLNIQRTLGRDILIEAAYVGSRGEHIWINREINAVSTSKLSLGTDLVQQVTNPYYQKIPGFGAQQRVARSQLLRPYPQYQGITRFRDAVGDSIYHAATLRVDKRAAHGLTLQGSYTFGKLIDNVPERFGGGSAFIDPNNLGRSRSISDEDRSQIAVFNYLYDLPFGAGRRWVGGGWGARLLGAWQITGITSFSSGRPIAVTSPSSTQLPGVSAYALRLRSPALAPEAQTLDAWFDKNAFMSAPPYSLGTDSRTQPDLRGPGIASFDVGVHRNQRIRDRINVQFRAELQNAFNRPQLALPIASVTAADFARITSGGSPRVIQFGLRISY